LNTASRKRGRFALHLVAAAALALAAQGAAALGLGRLSVQSALGEALRAEIDISSLSPEEADNLRIRIAPPEAYRSAGVEYNAVLPATQAVLMRRADGRPYLSLTSDRVVQEPFVDVILELSWATGRLVREYTLLFDPPSSRALAAAPPPITSAVIGGAAAPAPAAAPPARAAVPAAPRVAAAKPVVPAPATAAAPAPAPAAPRAPVAPSQEAGPNTGETYRVRSGDTLSRIAARTQRPGASLDQMLVSLYRGNPQAFVDNNMNRLRAGVVLAVPNAATAKAVPPNEAREVIQAQSADFGAYRQRLAGAVPEARTQGSARQASGKVQANVDDRKTSSAPAPDKLTLSKGAVAAKSAAEEKLSKEREQRDAATRVAELSKNVDELSKLSGNSAVGKPAPAAAPAAVASVPAIGVPVTVNEMPAKASAPAASPPPPAPASAAVPASAVVAAEPVPVVPPVVASAPAAASSVAKAPAPVTPEREAPGLVGTLLDDNPLALGLGAGLLAVLAGFGIWRFTRRPRKDSGETSFLESRLQPDSFFGASGGQRIDTRESGGASSSMSYSLSQLDAIGDVDPVAEADVYLAYGRDLQAEEILKEAMRSTPERMAIRTKLLEVYAKRRDTKGFELLATQLYAMTNGSGDDWARAQEMGRQIDPENALYRPGGIPAAAMTGESGRMVEPLGASTMPQTVLPSASQYDELVSELPVNTKSGVDLDLDLDIDVATPAVPSAPAPLSAPAPASFAPTTRQAEPPAVVPPPVEAQASAPAPLEFDLSSISLDLDDRTVVRPAAAGAPATPAPAAPAQPGQTDAQDTQPPPLGEAMTAPGDLLDLVEFGDADDPLARKLELAEEFRQIGDVEGARDLLQEVVSKGTGALRNKAQGMLDTLG